LDGIHTSDGVLLFRVVHAVLLQLYGCCTRRETRAHTAESKRIFETTADAAEHSVANNFLATVPGRINRSSGRESPPAGPGLADNTIICSIYTFSGAQIYFRRTGKRVPTARQQRRIGRRYARVPVVLPKTVCERIEVKITFPPK